MNKRVKAIEMYKDWITSCKEGTVILETGNGIVVEWDMYSKSASKNYDDSFKTVILYIPHTDNKELMPDDVFGTKYEFI